MKEYISKFNLAKYVLVLLGQAGKVWVEFFRTVLAALTYGDLKKEFGRFNTSADGHHLHGLHNGGDAAGSICGSCAHCSKNMAQCGAHAHDPPSTTSKDGTHVHDAELHWGPPDTVKLLKLMATAPIDIPLGAVLSWWRPAGPYYAHFAPAEGFEVADGTTVQDPNSPLYGATKPDLRGHFVQGAASLAEVGLSLPGVSSTTSGAGAHHHTVPPSPVDKMNDICGTCKRCAINLVGCGGQDYDPPPAGTSSGLVGNHTHIVKAEPEHMDLLKIIKVLV